VNVRAPLVSVLMAALATLAPAHAQEVPAGYQVSPMTRATIFVRDLDVSLKLYRDLLGLKARVNTIVEGSRINQIMGTKIYALKAVILQAADTIVGNIGIYELIGDERSRLAAPSTRTDTSTGDVAVVFITNNIDGLTEKVRAAGYPIISPPIVLFPREGAKVQTREMMFRDHDGVLVNLIELGDPRPW